MLCRSDVWPLLLTLLLGMTNGHLASLVCMHAPALLPPEAKAGSGAVLAFSITTGITLGSVSPLSDFLAMSAILDVVYPRYRALTLSAGILHAADRSMHTMHFWSWFRPLQIEASYQISSGVIWLVFCRSLPSCYHSCCKHGSSGTFHRLLSSKEYVWGERGSSVCADAV